MRTSSRRYRGFPPARSTRKFAASGASGFFPVKAPARLAASPFPSGRQAQGRGGRKSGQPIAGFGPADEHQQDRGSREPRAQLAQDVEAGGNGSVHVVEDDDERLLRTLLLEQADDPPDLLFLQIHGIDGPKGLVGPPGQRLDPGRDGVVVGRPELPQNLGGHPRAAHRSVGGKARSHDAGRRRQPARASSPARRDFPEPASPHSKVMCVWLSRRTRCHRASRYAISSSRPRRGRSDAGQGILRTSQRRRPPKPRPAPACP